MQQQRVLSWLSQHNFPHGLVSFADGLLTDPLGHKTAYLNNLIINHGVSIHSAYGSSKDIIVYTNIGMKPKQIYIVGKVGVGRLKNFQIARKSIFSCPLSGQQETASECHCFDRRICGASEQFDGTWWLTASARQSTYGHTEGMF